MIALLVFWPFYVAAILLILGCFAIESEKFTHSTIGIIASLGCIGWFYRADLLAAYESGGIVNAAALTIGIYFIAALSTAFIYWLYMVMRARRYLDDEEAPSKSTVLSEYVFHDKISPDEITSRIIELARTFAAMKRFMWRFSKKSFSVRTSTIQELESDLETSITPYFPPKAKNHRDSIVGSAIAWPCTLLWLVFYRMLSEVLNFIIRISQSLMDAISSLVFGNFSIAPKE